MNKTRFAARCIAGTLAATVMALGAFAAPAQAKDTGWGPAVAPKDGTYKVMKDTGWGPV